MPEDTPAPDPDAFDIEAWISGATRPETVIMLSSKGHEVGQFKALEVQLLAAQKAAEDNYDDQRLGGLPAGRQIAAQMDALAKVIDKGRRPFRLRGLSVSDLKAVRVESKDLDEDDTNALLLSKACIDPVLAPAQWGALREAIGEGQFVQAVREANKVSFGDATDAPFSLAASVALAAGKS